MSAKYGLVSYNSSRKHISISIPSTTEVMSPHIKSVEELRVLGINLSSFSAPSQFFICVAGVFLFYLIYGYLQVKDTLVHTSMWRGHVFACMDKNKNRHFSCICLHNSRMLYIIFSFYYLHQWGYVVTCDTEKTFSRLVFNDGSGTLSLINLTHIDCQELIFSVEGFKPFGWYLTLVQFGFYSMFGLVELQLTQDKRRRCS